MKYHCRVYILVGMFLLPLLTQANTGGSNRRTCQQFGNKCDGGEKCCDNLYCDFNGFCRYSKGDEEEEIEENVLDYFQRNLNNEW